jgi:hypothetical protein
MPRQICLLTHILQETPSVKHAQREEWCRSARYYNASQRLDVFVGAANIVVTKPVLERFEFPSAVFGDSVQFGLKQLCSHPAPRRSTFLRTSTIMLGDLHTILTYHPEYVLADHRLFYCWIPHCPGNLH